MGLRRHESSPWPCLKEASSGHKDLVPLAPVSVTQGSQPRVTLLAQGPSRASDNLPWRRVPRIAKEHQVRRTSMDAQALPEVELARSVGNGVPCPGSGRPSFLRPHLLAVGLASRRCSPAMAVSLCFPDSFESVRSVRIHSTTSRSST